MKNSRLLVVICLSTLVVGAVGATRAEAYTAQEIADCVIDELNNVTDYTATVDIDFDNESMDDMSGGALQWKRSSGTWKTKMVNGSPYTATRLCDGTVWNYIKGDHFVELSKEDGDAFLRCQSGADMFNMENILAAETWSKYESTETVNSVSCYRLNTSKANSNYDVWVDVATRTKVIRVKATDADDNLQWQVDYSDYTDVETTAQLPATIDATFYVAAAAEYTATYSFSDININEGLADSVFACPSDLPDTDE